MSRTMTAYRLTGGSPTADFAEVPVPVPGPGEVLVKVGGAGLCGTDLHFLHAPTMFGYQLPMTIGHEVAGWVDELGPGVSSWAPGDAVAVVASSFCGRCGYCVRGNTNYCTAFPLGRGFGIDGGLAEYVVVAQHELVALDTLEPHRAAPLTDAGATSYHAVRRLRSALVPGSTTVIIGVGGLGSYALQYVRMMGITRVVAVDTSPARLEHATTLGADAVVLSDADVDEHLQAVLGPGKAEVVMDFVGIDQTMSTAVGCTKDMGTLALVGAGGGTIPVGYGLVPRECEVWIPMGYNAGDLREVVLLAESGRLRIDVDVFAFADTVRAFEAFGAGELLGRAVVTPNA